MTEAFEASDGDLQAAADEVRRRLSNARTGKPLSRASATVKAAKILKVTNPSPNRNLHPHPHPHPHPNAKPDPKPNPSPNKEEGKCHLLLMRPKHKRKRFSDAEVARALRAAARAPKRDKAPAKGYQL